MKRRMLGLMLFSALVSPQIAMAAVCPIGNANDTAKSAGYILASSTLKGATYGAVAVGAIAIVVGTATAATVALPVFAGVTILTGVFPGLRAVANNAVNTLEASMSF